MTTLNNEAVEAAKVMLITLQEAVKNTEALIKAAENGKRNKANERRIRMGTVALGKQSLVFRRASVQ